MHSTTRVEDKRRELQVYKDARSLLDAPSTSRGSNCLPVASASGEEFNVGDSCLVFIGCNYFVLCTLEQGRNMLDRQISGTLEVLFIVELYTLTHKLLLRQTTSH